MIFYDEKTQGVIYSGDFLLLRDIDEEDHVTLKASFVVVNDIKCDGRVNALFDLFVLGNIECTNLDVKGKLICTGECKVENSLVVQNEIWVNELFASSIQCHDRVVAQSIDAGFIKADGNIVVGNTLAIEKKAETLHKVLCGETAYGAGKIVASTVMTAEELDLDDGVDSLEHPYIFKPHSNSSAANKGMEKYVANNDYAGYFSILKSTEGQSNHALFARAFKVFRTMNEYYPSKMSEFADVSILLWLIEATNSGFFSVWPQLNTWYKAVMERFSNLIHGRETPVITMNALSELKPGNIVSHIKFGQGVVQKINNDNQNTYVEILFDEYGKKTFPFPESMKLFSFVGESEKTDPIDAARNYLICQIDGYDEWLAALTILNSNKSCFSNELYNLINDMLFSQIGLKTKYIRDRMREKGWETNE